MRIPIAASFLLVLATYAASIDLETPTLLEDAQEVSAAQLFPPGKISLAQESLHDTEAMSDLEVTQLKHDFISAVAGFKSETLQSDSIATVRLAQHVMLGEGSKDQAKEADGLDLIFRKLNELKKKVEDEQKAETEKNNELNEDCTGIIKDQNSIIHDTWQNRLKNTQNIWDSNVQIKKGRRAWRRDRDEEDSTHAALVRLQAFRANDDEIVRTHVNERNKAIDVMVKATFLVCDSFNRYKNSRQCLEIKSQPDIDEPHRYETKPYEKAKLETERTHTMVQGQEKPPVWLRDWSRQLFEDRKLEGKPDPEGLLKAADAAPAKAARKAAMEQHEVQRLREADRGTTVTMLSEEEEDTTVLSAAEAQACKRLAQMTHAAGMERKYAAPLNELTLSLKAGESKRSKSIVTILLEVLKETREEQNHEKTLHTSNLNEMYRQSWDYMEILIRLANAQSYDQKKIESNRVRILRKLSDSEVMRIDSKKATGTRTNEQDSCAKANEEFGIREQLRVEDLENLAKLKSLLRALYEKKKPTACAKFNRVLCTSKNRGWCVFDKRTGNDQRCSCNVGFYGKACEFRMCPGLARNFYKAGDVGACSNRGSCEPVKGECICRKEYYNGPKYSCDYKHAPASMNGQIDNLCSNRGKVDRIRGICNCKRGFWGPGCEQEECPNSNGVEYPLVSGNACNGRGACDPGGGGCTCKPPYWGRSCEYEGCPEDCRGRGKCNMVTGKCSCNTGFFGPACEFHVCPNANPRPVSQCTGCGNCDRNNGRCVCAVGCSGEKCEKTSRCKAANLNNDKMNWWTVWDKPGWLVCPKGQLLYQLERSKCTTFKLKGQEETSGGGALSCVESGGCSAGCEGENHVFQLRHCYHDLRWYNSFDVAGWSQCLPDYFVAGLFRSCESLYCLNMAKCCSLKQARWVLCGKTRWGANFNGASKGSRIGKISSTHSFITGFRRSSGHTLENIEEVSHCGFVRGY